MTSFNIEKRSLQEFKIEVVKIEELNLQTLNNQVFKIEE